MLKGMLVKGVALASAIVLVSCQRVSSDLPPTVSSEPTLTGVPTIHVRPTERIETASPPDLPSDSRWRQWTNDGFELVTTSAPTSIANGQVRAFLITDGTKESIMATGGHVVNFEEAGGPGSCVVAFYRWDNPAYQEMAVFGETEYHYWCDILNWDAATTGTFFKFREPDASARQALSLRSTWSDMNSNGWPELAVAYNDCLDNCEGYEGITVRLYEVRDGSVVDIAAGLPGTLVPDDLLVDSDPPAFAVQSMVDYGLGQKVWRTSVVLWNGEKFEDRSGSFSDYYRGKIAAILSDVQARSGTKVWPYQTAPFLEILDTANLSGIPVEEGLAAFLQATDPKQWPETDSMTLCWLQLARAYAQIDAKAGGPFRLHAMDGDFVTGELEPLAEVAATLSAEGFETNACP